MTRTSLRPASPYARVRGVWAALWAGLGRVSVGILVVFHAWLFWLHATEGKLFEADVALRWLVAGAVALAFWGLRRLGLPLFRGRRAVVLWLLVVLIHGHAVWTGDAGQVHLASLPQAAVEFAPAGLYLAVAATALLFLAWWLQHAALPRRPMRSSVPGRRFGLPPAASTLPFSPRPPPLR